MTDDRVLVIKGKAGLGNRMLAAATGLLYARLAGRRPIIDWCDFTYSNNGENAFPRLFKTSDPMDVASVIGSSSVAPAIWSGRLDKSANDILDEFAPTKHSSPSVWRDYSIDLLNLHYTEQVAVFWSFTHQIRLLRKHFVGEWAEWAKLTDTEILQRLLRQDFQPHPDIQAKIDEFKDANFRGEVIGVHVRYMDRKTSITDFLKHLDDHKRRRPDAMIFLATDNRDAEATIRARYDNVVVTPKWFPESGVSMHQNLTCPDRFQNAVEAMIDMYLLAECTTLIYPGSSTFSWISSMMSDAQPSSLTDIERFNLRIRAKKIIRRFIQ